MLVLSRRLNQSIMIGDDVEIVIIDIKGDQVKIGIKAPKNIAIQRTEVIQEVQEENRQAMSVNIKAQDLGEIGKILNKKTLKNVSST
ncbi:MAG: carbon storage regulator CsrA [Leptospiraceae bacterium]|nr:carbon storage regulator CsrA [Leptospiraceae bacterium]MCP5497265.1 carbon storage regulator CsrA [Leptospiraceae bacterium]